MNSHTERYLWRYKTPEEFDDLLMCGIITENGQYLTELIFENSNDVGKLSINHEFKLIDAFAEIKIWLDIYFAGGIPDFTPRYLIENPTPFRKKVSDIMLRIPYGKTTTYNSIAAEIATNAGIAKMSAQAVGGAVGWNPICIIVPCHRVVGSNGCLTGYGGGIRNKVALLKLEGNDMSRFTLPKQKN